MMLPMTATAQCPMCQHPGQPGARYCERCGHDLAGPGSYVRWLTSADERDALDLGAVAGVTDPGAFREHNEDALAVGALSGVGAGSALTAVVCDGVSTSNHPELAARAATAAGIEAILSGLSAGVPPRDAIRTGGLAAAKAAAEQGDGFRRNPPACTYVSAVVTPGSVVVGWVGDSPAYWLSPGMPPLRLTVDDSAAGRLEAAGVPHDDERYGYPQAYALDRWLGADSPGLPIRTHVITPDRAGVVLVCSDGLTVEPPELVAAVSIDRPLLETTRDLLRQAIEAGSKDNITVAVLAHPGGGW